MCQNICSDIGYRASVSETIENDVFLNYLKLDKFVVGMTNG